MADASAYHARVGSCLWTSLRLAPSIFQTCGTAFFPVTERSKSLQHEFECSSPPGRDGSRNVVGAMLSARWRGRGGAGEVAQARWCGRDAVNRTVLRNATLGQAARRRFPRPHTTVWRPRPAFVNNPLISKATMSCTVEWAAVRQPHMQGHRPDG